MRAAVLAGLAFAGACKPAAPVEHNAVVTSAAAERREEGCYYTFTLGEGFERLSAEVCFEGTPPKTLVAPMENAKRLLRGVDGPDGAITPADGDIPLAGVGAGACVRYRIDADGALEGRENRRVGPDAILSPDWWFWGPDDHAAPMFARFVTPPGVRPAMPWPAQAGEAYPYRVPESLLLWRSEGAFVTRAPRTLAIADAELTVVEMGDGFGERRAAVDAWLAASGRAVASLLGGFPLPRAAVLLVADGARGGSFGYTLRGGGPAATMLMSAAPSDDDLASDWTAVHELLHFSHPPMGQSEAWFFEGLATYFTAVARARSGLTTRRYGWWELLDGFERGSHVGTGVSLRDECPSMHENATYWRVYWSGAFIALSIDVELRRAGQDLPSLWARLGAGRLADTHRWTGEELAAKLDALSGTSIATRVVAAHLDSRSFPDTSALRAALGVRIASGKSVDYDDAASDRAIRQAIMAGD
jgi:hypothetical protein